MQTNDDEGHAQFAREKMRATPLNGVRECRINISSSVYNRPVARFFLSVLGFERSNFAVCIAPIEELNRIVPPFVAPVLV